MERLIPKSKEDGSSFPEEDAWFIVYTGIVCVIFYFLFLIIEFIDLIGEMAKKDDEFYYFYFLRLIFFGISILIQVLYVILTISFFIVMEKADSQEDIENKILITYAKLYASLFTVWTIFLLATGIPRLIIFFNNREKIGKFIYSMIIIKIILLFPIYVIFIVTYVLTRENKKKDD